MTSGSGSSHEELLERHYEFRLGAYLSRGWEIFKANIGLFIAYLLVVGIIYAVLAGIDGAFAGDDNTVPRLGPGGAIQLIVNGPLSAGFF